MIDDEEKHPFEKWEDDLFNSIKSFSPSKQMLIKFKKYISDILSTSNLLPPIDEFTHSFLDEFCTKLILFILASHPPIEKGSILNSFLSALIPLYSKKLINNKQEDKFIKTSKMIIFDSKTQFYRFTSKSGNEESDFYDKNVQTFVKSGVIEDATEFIKSHEDIDIPKLLLFISNFHPFRNLFNEKSLVDFYSTASLKLQNKIHKLPNNQIRSVNEKEIAQAFIYIRQILSSDPSYSENLENLNHEMLILAIRFAKSPFLNKQYYGISTIRMQLLNSSVNNEKPDSLEKNKKSRKHSNSSTADNNNNNKDYNKKINEKEKSNYQLKLCKILDDEQVIPIMLHDLHHTLISEFLIVFKIMLQYNFITSDDLQEFWSLTLKQHQTTINVFIKAIEDLMDIFNEKLTKKLWKIFTKSEKFPNAVLFFFQKIANKGTDSRRIQLYNSLIVYYKKIESDISERSVLIDTMCVLLPENDSTCEELQQQCFETMEEENDPDYDYSLALLKASCKSMKPEIAHKSLHKLLIIMKKIQDKTLLKFLSPLQQMILHLEESFTDEEFEELLRITTLLITSNQEELILFYKSIFIIQNQKKKKETNINESLNSIELLHSDSNDYSEEEDDKLNKSKKEKAKNHGKNEYNKGERQTNNNYLLDCDKIMLLLKKMCQIDPPPIDFIIILFEEINKKSIEIVPSTAALPSSPNLNLSKNSIIINSSNDFERITKSAESLLGIDLLWEINFKYDDKMKITNYLCNLYSKSQNSDDIKNYMKRCLKHVNNESAFVTMLLMMDGLEWKFDKLSRNIEENKFYTKFECNEIHIIGYSSQKVRIPKLFQFEAFCERIAYLLELEPRDITIYVIEKTSNETEEQKKDVKIDFYIFNDNYNIDNSIDTKNAVLINHSNFSTLIKDDVTIGVTSSSKKNLSASFRASFCKEYSNSYFPSLYLSKPSHFSIIFEFVKNNKNDKLARIALDIVNRLPPSEKELEVIRSESEKKPNWKRLFSLKNNHWCIFLYRLNIIGCLLEKGGEWIDGFYMSGGSLWLSNILFTNALTYFSSDEDLELIMEVATLLLQKIENRNLKKKMITSLGNESAEKIVTLALDHKDSISLLLTLFDVIFEIADVLPTVFIHINSFIELFNLTIFHKNEKIRKSITKAVNLISPLKLAKPIIKQLPRANNQYCDEYFSIMNDIAQSYSSQMMKIMFDSLYAKYKMNVKANLIDQLSFVPPKEKFTHGFFKVLDQVVMINGNNITSANQRESFSFIVDNILFNNLKYYNPNQNLFNILSYFLNKDPKLAEIIIQKIFFEDFNNIDNYDDKVSIPLSHFTFVKHRGIKNLGATCYMNATIQALYNINRFRQLILKKHSSREIARMKQHYQNEKEKEADPKMNPRMDTDSNFYLEFDDYYENAKEEEEEEESSNSNVHFPDWFKNFQLIFGELLLYPTDYIDISKFVKSWKWYDEPVNFHMQQDAAEFVQMLLNRLSDELPIVAELFQGEICNETVGTNIEYNSQCKEKFVIFPLEVNGNSSVEESFNAFLMPDVFEGNEQYEAEEIGKINAKRYHWLSKAPQILILQLKRFSFNVKTGKREKLNNEYTFPFVLNLKAIMKSSRIDKGINDDPLFEEEEEEVEVENAKINDDCLYDLVAVEMHSGDAGSGHYFSFCGPPCVSKKQAKKWYKFDDKTAEKIDVNIIQEIAKGGLVDVKCWNSQKKVTEKITVNSTQNAYLLYYQKRSKKTEELILKEKQKQMQKESQKESEKQEKQEDEEESNNDEKSANSIESTNSNSSNKIRRDVTFSSLVFNKTENDNESSSSEDDFCFESFHHKIDNEIVQSIADEVEELVKVSIIRNPDYSRFLMSIADTSKNLNFVYNFLMNSLKNTKDKDEVTTIFTKLKEIMNPEISVRFLNEKTFIYNDYLVRNESREIRKICSDAVISAVIQSDNRFDTYLQFIENYLPKSISNWSHFDEFALPLVYIIEKKGDHIDKKKWTRILVDFLNTSLKNANNLQIYLSIKLDSIYRCLILLFSDSNLRKEFESIVFNMKFLRPLFMSRRNSKGLASLLRDFFSSSSKELNDSKKEQLFSMINKFVSEEEEEMNVICGVFSASLFFNKSNNANGNDSVVSKTVKEIDVQNRSENDEEEELSSIDDLSILSLFDTDVNTDNNDSYSNEVIENILSILRSATNEENKQFLCELILRIPYIQIRLIPFLTNSTYFWIIHWLFNVDMKIRSSCCELLYKVFNEFPRLTFYDDNNKEEEEEDTEKVIHSHKKNYHIYAKQSLKQIAISMYSFTKKFVEYSISRLKNSYRLHCNGVDTFRMLPYRNFYELLRWSIVRTDSASIILRRPKLLVNGMVKFKKVEKVNSDLCFATLRFIHSVIGIKHSKKFFKKRRFARKFVKVFSNATFDSINRYTSIETVSMIITLLPHLYSKYLFDTRFFRNSLEYCFSSISVTAPQLENYIIANAKLKSFAPYFWSDTVFNRNYKDSNYYLSLTTNLLTMKQKLSNLFFDLGRPKQIMKNLVAISSSSSSLINSNETKNKSRKSTDRSNSGYFSFLHQKNKNNKENLNENKSTSKNESNKKLNDFVQSNENENKNFIEFSSVSAKQIEVLVAFLRAYQQYGKKPRSLMKLMIGLRSEIERMLDVSLINNGNNVRTNVLLAIYKVLMQLFIMGSEFEQIVLNYVRNGLLGNAREDVWSGAIELIRFLCVILNANQKESTAYNLALNELLSLKKPYNFRIIIELCDIITTPLFLYEPPVDGIVEFLNEIRIAGEMPNPMPKEIKKLILTLRDKEAKGISKLVELVEAEN